MVRLSITTVIAALALAGATASIAQAPPAYVTAAVNDAGRPAADKERDVHRKPAEMLAIAEIKPGSKVGELIPGGGYFTRIFAKAVGPTGKVYAITNPPAAGRGPPAVRAIAADAGYSNVVVIEGPVAEFKTPEPVDVVWTSQNYHDVPPEGRAALNKAAFNALKPGGVYIVLDHMAAKGAGEAVHRTMHRADEDIVKAEVTAAGFRLDREYDTLRNPKDDHTKAVFDGSVRGDTDQFILKYRKPR
jgi:predicted methyltransferase